MNVLPDNLWFRKWNLWKPFTVQRKKKLCGSRASSVLYISLCFFFFLIEIGWLPSPSFCLLLLLLSLFSLLFSLFHLPALSAVPESVRSAVLSFWNEAPENASMCACVCGHLSLFQAMNRRAWSQIKANMVCMCLTFFCDWLYCYYCYSFPVSRARIVISRFFLFDALFFFFLSSGITIFVEQ